LIEASEFQRQASQIDDLARGFFGHGFKQFFLGGGREMKFPQIVLSACAVALAVAGCAGTQEEVRYPARPVTVVIPYPAGNAADVVGRIVADKLGQLWGQPVTVENRGGPTSVPGVDSVAKAKADGHTLLIHSVSYAVDAGLYTGLPYDPETSFVAVAPIARQPFVLVTSPALGVGSVRELVGKAKAGSMKYASLGTTTQVYFVAEQFRRQAKFDATNVSVKSLVEANGMLAKGDAAFWFPPVAGAMGGIKDGKLIPLAVTSDRRVAMLPQVPTMAEAGVPNMESFAWFGVWAPAGTSAAVVDHLAQDIERALAAPDVREKLAKLGAEPMSMKPGKFGRFVRSEIESSQRFTAELGIKPQAYVPPARQ
jgi:tripartite-type tricarboxylate transporter receptor subunit TctC